MKGGKEKDDTAGARVVLSLVISPSTGPALSIVSVEISCTLATAIFSIPKSLDSLCEIELQLVCTNFAL